MRNLLRRLSSDRRGGLIAEFAAAMPVLVLLLLGGVEVSRFALLNQKMDRLATAMGDLVAQAETLTAAELDQLFLAAEHVASPFDVQAKGRIIITSASIPAGQAAGSARHRQLATQDGRCGGDEHRRRGRRTGAAARWAGPAQPDGHHRRSLLRVHAAAGRRAGSGATHLPSRLLPSARRRADDARLAPRSAGARKFAALTHR